MGQRKAPNRPRHDRPLGNQKERKMIYETD
jgi:hypothetical protein